MDTRTRFYIEQAEKNRGEKRQVKVSTPEKMICQMALIMADEGVVYPEVIDDTQSREKVALNFAAPHIDIERPKLDKKGTLQWGVVESRVINSLNAAFLGNALRVAALETGESVYNPLVGREQTEQELESYYQRAVESLGQDEQRMEALMGGEDVSGFEVKDREGKKASRWRNIVGIPRNEWHVPAVSEWRLSEEEKEKEEKRKQRRRKTMVVTASVSAVLGACNSRAAEVVGDIRETVEPTAKPTSKSTVKPTIEQTKPLETSESESEQDKEEKVTPEVEFELRPPVAESFVELETKGKREQRVISMERLEERLLDDLSQEEVDEILARFKEALDNIDNEGELVVQIIERNDQIHNEWHNIIVGFAEEGEFVDQLWMYAEVDQEGSQYVPLGKGVKGMLIPISFAYEVEGERVNVDLLEGKEFNGLLFGLGHEEDGFQWAQELIHFDLDERVVYYTDPWKGEKYVLDYGAGRGVLAEIIPEEASLFTDLPQEKVKEALREDLVPEMNDEGRWVAKDEYGWVRLVWNEESSDWQEKEFDQEEFMSSLGSPEKYRLQVDNVEYIPGDVYAFYGEGVDVYAIVASDPYVKEWETSYGMKVDVWLVDLAFPNRQSGGWSKMPFRLWMDIKEDDPRFLAARSVEVNDINELEHVDLLENYKIMDHHFKTGDIWSGEFVGVREYKEMREAYLRAFVPGKKVFYLSNFWSGGSNLDYYNDFLGGKEPPGETLVDRSLFVGREFDREVNESRMDCFVREEVLGYFDPSLCDQESDEWFLGGVIITARIIDDVAGE